MKTKFPFIIPVVLLTLTSSCKKKDDSVTPDSATPNTTPITGTVTDIDNNVYHTVTIGKQTWTSENLKVTKYRNGNQIPNVIDNTQWGKLTTGAYCDYYNNTTNVATYGRLYNWHAIHDSRNIAPTGWPASIVLPP
ncbi:MAG TPA: FISUMP domain-containing protein [Bacteroidia bacterium]|nr:FISUMP domain-containing protein [Bacteroidia bacterium]